MTTVLVTYDSDYGNTKTMAEAVAEGVDAVDGCESLLKDVSDATAEDVEAAAGVIVGTPVHMGACSANVKKWIDEVCGGLWMENKAVGKVGAVFASGSGYGSAGGGCELAMLSVLTNLAELGMILVSLPKATAGYERAGLHWGPYGRSATPSMEQVGVGDTPLEVCRNHGRHVANIAKLHEGQTVFTKADA